MKPPPPADASAHPVETLTIRMAVPADARRLSRLAELDSAPQPEPVPMLIAEVGGELRAALPLDGGRPIADPFQPTAALIVMLAQRARQRELSALGRPERRRRAFWPRRQAMIPHA